MSSTTIGDHIRLRRARHQTTHHHDADDDDPPLSHVVLPLSQPNRFCNSAMSSFFLLPSSSTEPTTKKKPLTSPFRGMGCTAAQEVSVPSVIRSSADWDAKIRNDKKKKNKRSKGRSYEDGSIRFLSEGRDVDGGGCVAIPDVWCGPGLGFSTDAVVGRSVDSPVVSVPPRRNIPSSRRKIDVDKSNSDHTGDSSVIRRRLFTRDSRSHTFLNSDSAVMTSSHAEPTLLSSRYHGHLRRPYPGDLTEVESSCQKIMMLRNGFVMGRLTDSRDNFRDLRLDVDSMSYEQLLELGDRIGNVNTGLKESEIHCCLRETKPSVSHTLADRKCSICQDDYETEDEVGKLQCGHSYHVECVKQWLWRKNACPVCKKTAYVKP